MGIYMNSLTVGDHIRRRRRELKLSQQDLAKKASVSQATVSDLERGRSNSSRELPSIAPALLLTVDELLSGDWGEQKDKQESNVVLPFRSVATWESAEDLGDEYITIPRLDLEASCGGGRLVIEVNEKGQGHAFRKSWFEKRKANPVFCTTIEAVGDSMADRIMDGDTLVVDVSQTTIKDGHVYAFCMFDEWFVKRIFKQSSGGLILSSDNPNKKLYPDRDVSPEEVDNIIVFGRVIGLSGGL